MDQSDQRDPAHGLDGPAAARGLHRRLVARAFQIIGGLVGGASAVAAVAFGFAAFRLHEVRPAGGGYLDIQTYGLTGVLANGAHGLDHAASGVAGLASGISGALAAGALVIAMFGLALYLMGRGLFRRAAWARIAAILATLLSLVITLGALTVLPRGPAIGAWLIVGFAVYSLWTLTRRFR